MNIDYRYMPDGMYIGLASTGFMSCFLSLAGSASLLYFILISNRRNKNKRRESSSTMESQQNQEGNAAALSLVKFPSMRNVFGPKSTAAPDARNSHISTASSSGDDTHPSTHEKLGLYHRLLVGLSIVDMISSVAVAIQPIMLPSSTRYFFAAGNTTTCRVAGFWFQFFNGSFLYSAGLSVYFYLTIRLGKKEKEAAALLEPYVHIISIAVPLTLSVLGLSFDFFHPSVFFISCYYVLENEQPECVMTSPEQQQALSINCSPSLAKTIISWIPALVTVVAVFTGLGATFLVYWTVRKQTLASRRHSFDGEISAAQLARTRAVGRQAVLYLLAYLNGFVIAVFTSMLPNMSRRKIGDPTDMYGSAFLYVTIFLVYIFFPLQGFFNCIIFMRPRLVKWKEAEPAQSWFWCYRKVLSGDPLPIRRPNHHSRDAERFSGAKHTRFNSMPSIHHRDVQEGYGLSASLASVSCQTSSSQRPWPRVEVPCLTAALTSEGDESPLHAAETMENDQNAPTDVCASDQTPGSNNDNEFDAVEDEAAEIL